MAQSSGPIAQGTDAERQFTDVMWRDLFGDEPGVVGDLNGSSYLITLPPDSDIAQVGAQQQDSVARVAGFAHRIPAGQPEAITIPAASGSARTDIIALRYDPAFTGAPGPVRLVRIEGNSTGLPAYDASPPGVEDLPLHSITRQPGQALSQATVRQLFPRIAPSLTIPVGAALPLSSPLGTTVRQGNAEYARELGAGGVPIWVDQTPPVVNLSLGPDFEDWGFGYRRLCYWREGRTIHVVGNVRLRTSTPPNAVRRIATLPTDGRPGGTVVADGVSTARVRVLTDGQVQLENATFNVTLSPGVLIPVNLVLPLG